MASLHMKYYEVAIWRVFTPSGDLPDMRVQTRAITPLGAVADVFSRLAVSSAGAVFLVALDYDRGHWLFDVRYEGGSLTYLSSVE